MSSGLPPSVTATFRGARLERGWRNSELARELRCSRRFVEMVEAGDCIPSVHTLELWCRVLDLDRSEVDALHDLRDVVAR